LRRVTAANGSDNLIESMRTRDEYDRLDGLRAILGAYARGDGFVQLTLLTHGALLSGNAVSYSKYLHALGERVRHMLGGDPEKQADVAY
jgi:hypothetical protein